MAKIILLDEWRKRKEIERKEMAEVNKLIRKIKEPSRLGMWVSVVIMAFMPWFVYFLVLCLAKSDLTAPQMQEVKLMAALLAAFISPFVTLTVAQMATDETKKK